MTFNALVENDKSSANKEIEDILKRNLIHE